MGRYSALLLVTCIALCVCYSEGASLTTAAVTFGSVKSSGVGVTSFAVTFKQATNLTLNQLKLVVTATSQPVSLSGASLSPNAARTVWTVTKAAGFNPSAPTAQLTVTFSNAPAPICTPPVGLADVTKPTTVVGTGTAASCTEAAFTLAVSRGGIITFNCGSAPVTITVTSVKNVTLANDTIIDGKGLITLSGGGKSRILAIQNYYNLLTPRVTLQNLAFTGGYTTDVANTTSVISGGGALYRLGGAFTIINCDFYGNQAPLTGQDVGGGAIYSFGGSDTTIIGSTFSGNMASNGGAIGNLGNTFNLYNSLVNGNKATGNGGNPGNGGNGAGVCFDGQGVNTYICGSTISYNTANQFGGGSFRVGYQYTDSISFINSTLAYNQAGGMAGGIYAQGLTFNLYNSTLMYNSAPGSGGIFFYSVVETISGCTFANNTATTSLAGAIGFSGSGTVSDTTVVGNVAGQAFAAGFSGGDSNTVLSRNVIAYSTEGNIWVALSCFSTLGDGGGNIQWPATRQSGQADTPCAAGVQFVDPMLAPVADNGCVTWTAQPLPGSPAANVGARCPAGSVSPVRVLTYDNGQAVPRGPFSYTMASSSTTTTTTTAPKTT